MMQKSVSEVIKSLPPNYFRLKDRNSEFPRELWDELSKGGWLGVNVPTDYGGAGRGILEMSLVQEAVSRAGAGIMGGDLYLVTCAMVPEAIKAFGTDTQKQKYLWKIAKGELVCAIMVTEPGAGINTLDISTFAEKRGHSYYVRGQKIWITFAPVADLALLVARTAPKNAGGSRTDGLSAFLLDMKQPAIRVEKLDSIAMKPLGSSLVFLDDAEIPEENLLGELDHGWSVITHALNAERIATASMCIGTSDLVLEKAVEHAKQRVVFGRPIGQNQAIQFPLADSKAKIELARLMCRKAAWLFDQGKPCAFEANVAAYAAAQSAFEIADRAIQTFGGSGFSAENDIERHWRDLRLFRVAPVPEQMVLAYIAQNVLALPRSY